MAEMKSVAIKIEIPQTQKVDNLWRTRKAANLKRIHNQG